VHENILTTINGQIDDIFNEATSGEVSEAMIMRVMERKTPQYTILGPLELGAQLAGKDLSQPLRNYSLSAGVAYQIADDIISTFGRENETGKAANDDIKEGKLTLLAYFAQQKATPEQRKTLSQALGNSVATNEQCDVVRTIFIQTGALGYAKEKGVLYEKKALAALDADTATDQGFIMYLRNFTDYIVNRRA
jgi:geranylgeranyl diphosphate synthase type I